MKISTYKNRKAQHFCDKNDIERLEETELYNSYGKHYHYRKCGEHVITDGLDDIIIAELLYLTDNADYSRRSQLSKEIQKMRKIKNKLEKAKEEAIEHSFLRLSKEEIKDIKENPKARKWRYSYAGRKYETKEMAEKNATRIARNWAEDKFEWTEARQRRIAELEDKMMCPSLEDIEEQLRMQEFAYPFRALIKTIAKKYEAQKPRKQIDPVATWCRRLSRLTGITLEEAQKIANEKLEYKQECIERVEEREYHTDGAVNRQIKLLRKMERENPLRRIKSEEHAYAILAASRRHNESNYEEKLEEAKELAQSGDIDYDEVQEYARTNLSYT